MKIISVSLPVIVFLFSFASFAQSNNPAAELFVKKCSECHSFGDDSGIDLAGAAKFEKSKLISNINRMQENTGPLTSKEIESLANFLKSANVANQIKQVKENLKKEKTKLKSGSKKEGKKIFFGIKPLQNGGTACIACHNAFTTYKEGGKLGPTLSGALDKYGKEALISAISGSKWKIMRSVYKDHPITRQEASHLVAYLESVSGKKREGTILPFLLTGISGCFLVLIIIGIFYRKRGRN